jgi:hypothetical protein
MKNDNRTILEVPYTDKNEAKALGAWWDPELKKWFVPSGIDLRPFAKWHIRKNLLNKSTNRIQQKSDH